MTIMEIPEYQRPTAHETNFGPACRSVSISTEKSIISEPGVYDDAMGLFRRRAKKNREKAAADLLEQQSTTATEQAAVAPRTATAEARPNPDKPGWGETIGQQLGKPREERTSQE
jgi:hypothetical protein